MDVPNPRRILAVGAPDSGVLNILRDLTGSAPEPVDNSTAGLSHEYHIQTRYYNAAVPVWVDEIADVEAWRTEFTKPEAKEVIQAVGGWIYCFRRPVTPDDVRGIEATLKAVSDAIERGAGYGWEGVRLAVAAPQSTTPYLHKEWDEWDELCGEHGFEYIDSEAKGRNEYGEPVGMERLMEALAANDWTSDSLDEDAEEALAELELDGQGLDGSFAAEEVEMNMELFDMKAAVNDVHRDVGGEAPAANEAEDDEATQVDNLENMMIKMQAIRDLGSTMPEDERKRYAAKAVNDLMKGL